MINKDLKRRIIEISYPRKLSHLGSCLTAMDIIKEIYDLKKPNEKFILSSGHAHIAHAVMMESLRIIKDVGDNIDKYGIHCERPGGCDYSTGSLGQGLPAAVGMALADRSKNVYCLISDGECAEGSMFEALQIIKQKKVINLKIYLNNNGWAAYQDTKDYYLKKAFTFMLSGFGGIQGQFHCVNTNMNDYPEWLQGQQAHYLTLNEEQYKEIMEILK